MQTKTVIMQYPLPNRKAALHEQFSPEVENWFSKGDALQFDSISVLLYRKEMRQMRLRRRMRVTTISLVLLILLVL